MKAMLRGYRRVDMVDDRSRPIKGFSCFISYPSEGVVGEETTKQFISDELAQANSWAPDVGKEVMIDFTPRGRVSSIVTVRDK